MRLENYGMFFGKYVMVKRLVWNVIFYMLWLVKFDEGWMLLRFYIDRLFIVKKKFVCEGMYKVG